MLVRIAVVRWEPGRGPFGSMPCRTARVDRVRDVMAMLSDNMD
ncbi:MAG: hypothetical protein ACC645_12485 [Pirellulales bacterium]